MYTDTLIVGGGLSGLSLAHHLQSVSADYFLVEARDRLGGRVKTDEVTVGADIGHYDLGPAWFWPGQPRMATLIKQLGLEVFSQYASGELMYEDAIGDVFRGQGYASMAGSYRLKGGFKRLIQALAEQLPIERISLSTPVQQIRQDGERIIVCFSDISKADVVEIECARVVLALPPRLAASTIRYTPVLASDQLNAMLAIPTWMAGYAKVLAVYETPFWRDAGLSGDAMSRHGPLMEIHDASPAEGGPYALFGFVEWSVDKRKNKVDHLIKEAKAQLSRLFGQQANSPIKIILQDWAFEPETASILDSTASHSHPAYGLPNVLSKLWGNRLLMGSTEVAGLSGGYLEGALEVSESLFAQIQAIK